MQSTGGGENFELIGMMTYRSNRTETQPINSLTLDKFTPRIVKPFCFGTRGLRYLI
jgi:hypothetical protein